mmetsp:Transcript_126365/g.223805  ORF Transcript_126365/g.223805 Transcript_126365/m.223805 type:complete len:304 (-) Transcript_126365:50-961(-)
MEHVAEHLRGAVLSDTLRVHMSLHVLLHLLHALLHRHVFPEVSPVAHEKVKRLKRSVNFSLVDLVTLRLHLHGCLVNCGLGKLHEIGQVVNLILLDLLRYVVDKLGGQDCCQAEDGCRLLLCHGAVPGTLRIEKEECHFLPFEFSHEWLGPDPDALCAHVHAAFEAEAVLIRDPLDSGTCRGHPSWQRIILATATLRWRWASLCARATGPAALFIPEISEEKVQEEGFACAKGSHHRDDRHLLRTNFLQPLAKLIKHIIHDLDRGLLSLLSRLIAAVCEPHKLQRLASEHVRGCTRVHVDTPG